MDVDDRRSNVDGDRYTSRGREIEGRKIGSCEQRDSIWDSVDCTFRIPITPKTVIVSPRNSEGRAAFLYNGLLRDAGYARATTASGS